MLGKIRFIKNVILRGLVLALTLVMLTAVLPVNALAAYNMPYYIEVDVTNQIVTIFNTADGSIARQMLTSSGANGATPLGTYKLYGKARSDERSEWRYLSKYRAWVHYATRIEGPYLFHSFPYDQKDESTIQMDAVETFGYPTSHGCLRLRTEDAKFIAERCLKGTSVKIHESGQVDNSLRTLLFESSYTGENGMTYAEFQGVGEGELSRGSTGSKVLDLQYRLGDLGYYEGRPDGRYDVKTANAVAEAQKDMGLEETGACTDELLETLLDESAPTSAGTVTITEGKSGPNVNKLQQALVDIGLYSGDMDGIYDIDVIEAVKKFQSACGYSADGVATPEIQYALYYQRDKLAELFGEDAVPQPELVTEEVQMATVSASTKIIIRSQASTSSKERGKVSNGDKVMVLGTDSKWAKIYVNGVGGYMYKKYLVPYTEYNYMLKYSANGTDYSIGHTMEEYAQGAPRFSSELRAIVAAGEYAIEEEKFLIATVNTGSDTIMLNLRAEANAEAEVLEQIPNGTAMRIMEDGEEWSKVAYGNSIGYLMNTYLDITEGTAEDLEAAAQEIVEDEVPEKVIPCRVACQSGAGGKVYEAASAESTVLGSLKNGTELDAIGAVGSDWIKISYQGKQGYMLKQDLQPIG